MKTPSNWTLCLLASLAAHAVIVGSAHFNGSPLPTRASPPRSEHWVAIAQPTSEPEPEPVPAPASATTEPPSDERQVRQAPRLPKTSRPAELGQLAANSAAPALQDEPLSMLSQDQLQRIRQRVEAALVYPHSLQRRRITGEVLLALSISPNGKLLSSRVARSSGSAELDALAVESLQRAAPFDPIERTVTLELPVAFRIR